MTCGTIKGGYGYNIIADQVEICGTCRSFTPQVQEMIKDRMNDICCGVAKMYGGEIDMEYHCKYCLLVFQESLSNVSGRWISSDSE